MLFPGRDIGAEAFVLFLLIPLCGQHLQHIVDLPLSRYLELRVFVLRQDDVIGGMLIQFRQKLLIQFIADLDRRPLEEETVASSRQQSTITGVFFSRFTLR